MELCKSYATNETMQLLRGIYRKIIQAVWCSQIMCNWSYWTIRNYSNILNIHVSLSLLTFLAEQSHSFAYHCSVTCSWTPHDFYWLVSFNVMGTQMVREELLTLSRPWKTEKTAMIPQFHGIGLMPLARISTELLIMLNL